MFKFELYLLLEVLHKGIPPIKETNMSLPISQGTWSLDPAHTQISFTARHLGIAKVRGTFEDFSATLTAGDSLEDSSVEVQVDLLSVTTGNADRDAHLKGEDFFGGRDDTQMKFVSTKITGSDDDFQLAGDLTISGKTLPIVLDVEFNGAVQDPWGNTKAGFEATGEINRSDFGLNWNVPVGDGLLVSEKIKIAIDAQFIPAS